MYGVSVIRILDVENCSIDLINNRSNRSIRTVRCTKISEFEIQDALIIGVLYVVSSMISGVSA